MKLRDLVLLGWMLALQATLTAHEGYSSEQAESTVKFIQWVGQLHLVFLHFPIALIIMTGISECLFWIFRKPVFDQAARFMIISAAIVVIPTVLFGLAYGYGVHYDPFNEKIYWWHLSFGMLTAVLTIVAAFLRGKHKQAYYLCLTSAFIAVNIAAFFGGLLTFGVENLFPPGLH